MVQWFQQHQVLIYWVTGASVVMCVGTLFLVPAMLIRIPADYFAHDQRPPGIWADQAWLIRILWRAGRNLLGYVFIAVGIALLMLPGQGLLTILAGFLLVEFPGKYRMEQWLFSRGRVSRTINWLRHRAGRPPLQRCQRYGPA